MDNLDVRIEELGPVRVASALGYGPNPEELAGKKLREWARMNGLAKDLSQHRFFGFNNPGPSAGSPNYGYEQWMTVRSEAKPSHGVEIKECPGGSYAVKRCQLKSITAAWQELIAWREQSEHRPADGLCLEECLEPAFFMFEGSSADPGDAAFDLYLPIVG